MPNTKNIIYRLIGAQWLAIGFVGFVSFIVGIVIARTLGPNLFGAYTTAISFAVIASIFIDGGFVRLIQREVASPSLNIHLSPTQFLNLAYGHLVVVTLSLLTLSTFAYREKVQTLIFAILFFSVLTLNQVILSFLRAEGRLVREALWQMLNRLLTAAAVVVFILYGAALPWHMFFAQFLGALLFITILLGGKIPKPDFNLNWSLYRLLLPFVWLDFATIVCFKADILILDFFNVPAIKIGQYAVAYRLIEAVTTVSAPIGLMLFRWFRQNISNSALVLSRLRRYFIVALLISLVLASFFYFGADEIIGLAYGEKFKESSLLLKLICWGLIFIIPSGIFSHFLLALGKERQLAWLMTLIAIFNVLGNVILIPEDGVMGAAWMMLITQFLLMLGLFSLILKEFKQ